MIIEKLWDCRCLNKEENCPCILAVLNTCPYCDFLKGNELCNCNWEGYCPLLKLKWEDIKDLGRGDNRLEILKKVFISKNCLMVVVKIPELSNLDINPGNSINIYGEKDGILYELKGIVLNSLVPYSTIAIGFDVSNPNNRIILDNFCIKSFEKKNLNWTKID